MLIQSDELSLVWFKRWLLVGQFYSMWQYMFFGLLSISTLLSIPTSVTPTKATSCGIIGIPIRGKVSKANGIYTYTCSPNTILIGDSQRICNGSSFTGTVPACIPLSDKSSFGNLSEDISDLMDINNKNLCYNESITIDQITRYVSSVYVWLKYATSELVFHSNSLKPLKPINTNKTNEFYTFEVNHIVSTMLFDFGSTPENNCFTRILFANSSFSVGCGTPDVPINSNFHKVDDLKGYFSCSMGYKLKQKSNSIRCIGQEKWNDTLTCVKSNSTVIIIVVVVLLSILVLVGISSWVILKMKNPKKSFNKTAMVNNVIESCSRIKVDPSSVTVMRIYDKSSTCSVYTAQFKGRIVCAHLCGINSSDNSMDGVRCLVQSVTFNYKHPNLVPLIAITKDPKGNPLLIFPYYGNGHLDMFVRDNPNLSTNKLHKLCLDVTNGMRFLIEKMTVIHRDLRANNCFVDDSMVVKIGCFNYAYKLNSKESYTSKETIDDERIAWAAPESIANNTYSEKSDVWSYGVLMWEVFSIGDKPYYRMNQEDITMQLLNEERLKKPMTCPSDTYALMNECWKLDSLQRPSFKIISEKIETKI